MKVTRPAIIAHRGLSSRYPENTLAAIEAALEEGVDMIEVDVALTADGIPVLLHDLTLDRTTNGRGAVNSKTLSQIKKLDAGSWYGSQFSSQAIPTLTELFELVKGRKTILLEIKAGRKTFPGIEKAVADCIRKYDMVERVIVQSFENDVLKAFRSEFPGLSLHKLVTGNLPVLPLHVDSKVKFGRITRYKTFDAINIKHKLLNRRKLKKIRERGQMVFVWTVNTEPDMEKMIRLGVDGIITDYPDRLKKLLDKMIPGMRVISEYVVEPMKVSVFSWNEKFMVKIEYGPYEQWFKFPAESVSPARLKEVMDDAFFKKAEERFVAMHLDMKEAYNRHKE